MIERLGSPLDCDVVCPILFAGLRIDPPRSWRVGQVYRPGRLGTLSKPRHTRRAAAVYRPDASSDQSPASLATPAVARYSAYEDLSNATPRSRSDTKLSPATMRWSRSWMSRRRPAARVSDVNRRSSGLGVGSPDGWLWTRIRQVALRRTASRNSSPTRTRLDDTLPWYTVTRRRTVLRVFSSTTRSSSRSR